MDKLLEKGQSAFSAAAGGQIYGREHEKQLIRHFLEAPERTLHIVGKPGTGKTCTVLAVLHGRDYAYLNYFHEPSIGKVLAKTAAPVVVVDEFDRYFAEKKAEAMRHVIGLGNRGIKLITISNNLRMGSLEFRPYDSEGILAIINAKMTAELGAEIIDRPALLYLVKRFGQSGDLRIVFKSILELLLRKAANTGGLGLQLADCLSASLDKPGTRNIQHQMIMECASGGRGLAEAYGEYLKECSRMDLPVFTRQDFAMVFELYK